MGMFDVALIAIIGFNAGNGIIKGLVRVVVDLVSFAASIWAATALGTTVGGWLHGVIPDPTTATVAGYIATWGIIYLGIRWVGSVLSAAIPAIGLGLVNRIGGLVAGTAKGILFCIPVMLPFQLLNPSVIETSAIAPLIQPFTSEIQNRLFPSASMMVPAEFPAANQ